MKSLVICYFIGFASMIFGQNDFNDCAAVCLDQVALVEEYSPRASCSIAKNAKGTLSVYTVEISEKQIQPKEDIEFKIAIRDAGTQTIWSFSDKVMTSIDVKTVLANCEKGDQIIIMMVNKSYALPHNEILVK